MSGLILTFDNLSSTNDYIKDNKDLPHGTIIRARFQDKGRGRFERRWESERNKNVLCSMLVKTEQHIDYSIKTAEIIQSVLKTFHLNATIKYPNDVLVDNKKIAGVLIETSYEGHTLKHVIIGIGLNVEQTRFHLDTATSLALENVQTTADEVFSVLTEHLYRQFT